ncbi:MAG: S8 family serine peptidase, partial [Euryarchaeota archaeon]|nr:S8 family serine peptidase [Euryarchaeota archaeon]
MEESELPPIPDLPDSIFEDKDGSLVEDVQVGQIQRFSMLDDDIQGLRTLIAALSFVAILLTAAVVGVTLRNWLQEEIDSVASEQLKARAAKYDALVQFDQVGNFTGDGVLVCIVDSGIDLTHPDLNHVTLRGWKDFIGNNPNPYDDHGHGTAMAGILVADGQLVGKARG